MSGPWEDFQASSDEEDGPWADFGGSKIKNNAFTEESLFVERQKQILPDLAKNLGGVGEVAAGMATSILPNIYGGLRGVSSLLAGEGVDKATERLKEGQEWNFGAGAYKPFSQRGKEFTESSGEFLNKPIELAGDVGESLGGNKGRFAGELLAGTAMEFMPLVPFAARGKVIRPKKASKPKAEVPSVKTALEAIDKQTKAPLEGQGDLFPETLSDPTGHASPYDASTIGTTEPITPKRARAQQELPLRNDLPESINVDREGVTLRPEDMAAVEAAKNAEVTRLDQEAAPLLEQERRDALLNAKQEEMWATDHPGDLAPDGEMAPRAPTPELTQQGELFAPQTNMHRDYTDLRLDDGRGGERPLTKKEFEQVITKLEQEKGTAFTRPEDVDAAYADYMNSVRNPSLFDTPARQEAHKAAAARMGEGKGMGEVSLENVKKSKISSSGKAARQRGALDLSDLRLGFGGLQKRLSKLTDILAQDVNWQYRMIQSLGGKEYLKNSDGSPKVLLHGTTQNIQGALRGSNEGFHAGTAPEGHIIVQKGNRKGWFRPGLTRENAQMYPIVLREGNYPKIPYDAMNWDPKKIVEEFDLQSPRHAIKRHIEAALTDKGYTDSQIKGLFNYVKAKNSIKDVNEAFSDVLKRADIDGFFYRNRAESPRTQKLLDGQSTPLREKVARASDDPTSFVTWNDRNFKSIFDLPEIPRSQKPIGQRGFANKETGAVMLPFGKKPALDKLKKVEGIKQNLRHFFPEERPVEDVIREHVERKTPDVDQNWAQKAINHFTKGSLYQAIKTDNPIVKFVGDKFRAADNQIKAQTGELIHDTLAPLAQRLSKQEKADVWALQNYAEAKGFALTPEFLTEHGFNAKQIEWVTAHTEIMKQMYEKMAATMKEAGLKPVSARTAYLASRARGDFRKLVYHGVDESGKPKVVGIIGDNTRFGLNKQAKQLKEKYPEYELGDERYFGGRSKQGTEEGFAQALEFLSDNDPSMKTFLDRISDLLTQDAYNYMNAKSHTMQKKRVFGMEGRKEFQSAVKNAEEGMQAQVRYAETMIKWSELSKAAAEVKPLLAKDNGLDMPNAKDWAKEYIQGALGNSPGELGRAIDNVLASAGKATGLGTSLGAKAMTGTKQAINGLLLGFWNAGFLAMSLIQPVRNMPSMAAYIKSKGVDVGVDIGLGRGINTMINDLAGKKLSDVEQGALDYAKKNHVYSSNLFESGNTVSKDFGYWWQKGTQSIASGVEQQTRKLTYLSYVHMLSESGLKPKDGLYAAAHNATDVHMNNYSQAEAPRIHQEMGPLGRTSYNLLSFKYNELSRISMMAREMSKGNVTPFTVELASQIAVAGLTGMILFPEADAAFEKITAMMGKPMSLKKMVLENPEIGTFVQHGLPGYAGLDLSSRMGIQVAPDSVVDTIMPGASKLGNIASTGIDAVTKPSEYNTKNFVREALPNSVAGILDRAWFSPENAQGEELSLNRNKVQANAVRNNTDKLWKSLGLTGTNESKQKALDYANSRIEQVYKDKRKSVIDKAAKSLFTSGKLPADFATDYIKNQGDPSTLDRELQTMALEQKVDQRRLRILRNAASNSLTSTHSLMRATGRE